MRSMVFASLGLAAGIVWAGGALAQNIPSTAPNISPTLPQSSPSTEERSSIPRAPIGHRQPTPKDLPPDVLNREQSDKSSGPMIVQPPSICRNC
jgi:hypothetical protein